MSAEVCVKPHLSSTTQPNVRESLYQTSPVLNHSTRCPRKFISNLTCPQPLSQMSAEVYIKPHLSSTTQPNVRESLYQTSPVLNHSTKCPRKFISNLTCPQPLSQMSAEVYIKPHLSSTTQPNVRESLYQTSPVLNHSTKCPRKFISNLICPQPQSQMSAEVYIEPHLSSTTQPNVRGSFYRTSRVFNHTANVTWSSPQPSPVFNVHWNFYQLSPVFNHS